jgi:hypothetical protein
MASLPNNGCSKLCTPLIAVRNETFQFMVEAPLDLRHKRRLGVRTMDGRVSEPGAGVPGRRARLARYGSVTLKLKGIDSHLCERHSQVEGNYILSQRM